MHELESWLIFTFRIEFVTCSNLNIHVHYFFLFIFFLKFLNALLWVIWMIVKMEKKQRR